MQDRCLAHSGRRRSYLIRQVTITPGSLDQISLVVWILQELQLSVRVGAQEWPKNAEKKCMRGKFYDSFGRIPEDSIKGLPSSVKGMDSSRKAKPRTVEVFLNIWLSEWCVCVCIQYMYIYIYIYCNIYCRNVSFCSMPRVVKRALVELCFSDAFGPTFGPRLEALKQLRKCFWSVVTKTRHF